MVSPDASPTMHSLPITPPNGDISDVYTVTYDDLNLLSMLTSPIEQKTRYRRRDAPLDPLLLAAAAASGPHITRHHYHHHDIFPDVPEEIWDWNVWEGSAEPLPTDLRPTRYVSKQAPRSARIHRDSSVLPTPSRTPSPTPIHASTSTLLNPLDLSPDAPLQIQCMARTRIPTPHGPAFLHLYQNNKDSKEHLAIVIDPAQFQSSSSSTSTTSEIPHIRSRTLDRVWSESESEMDRITRGAYIGKLSPSEIVPSDPCTSTTTPLSALSTSLPAPLVRIHSECFTGETIGSMRCDCGEQLDEALRLISQPTTSTIPSRGAIIYLRQEGRNIGLLSKIRAYNLQDMGHDTVTANLMLGHGADERKYDIAGAIMKDLGLETGVRLLTNNPDKVRELEKEGVRVVERVGMIPRSWTCLPHDHHPDADAEWQLRSSGATLIGGGAARGQELDRYLRTKVEKMGHLLNLPSQ